jgi:hypothetical protein
MFKGSPPAETTKDTRNINNIELRVKRLQNRAAALTFIQPLLLSNVKPLPWTINTTPVKGCNTNELLRKNRPKDVALGGTGWKDD